MKIVKVCTESSKTLDYILKIIKGNEIHILSSDNNDEIKIIYAEVLAVVLI